MDAAGFPSLASQVCGPAPARDPGSPPAPVAEADAENARSVSRSPSQLSCGRLGGGSAMLTAFIFSMLW